MRTVSMDQDAGTEDASSAAPSRPSLVPNSGSQLVLQTSRDDAGSDLRVVDLETKESTDPIAVPLGPYWPLEAITPDQRTLILPTANGSGRDVLYFARLEPDGYVPAEPLVDEERPIGAEMFAAWVAGGRYGAFVRLSPSDSIASGVDLVDVAAQRVIWHEDGEARAREVGESLTFASAGVNGWFAGQLGPSGRGFIARVDDRGDVTEFSLPKGARLPLFDPDGDWAAYAVKDAHDTSARLELRELSTGATRVIADEAYFEARPKRFFKDSRGDSLFLFETMRIGSPNAMDLRMVSLAEAERPSALLVDATRNPELSVASRDSSELLVTYIEDGQTTLELVDPTNVRPALNVGTYPNSILQIAPLSRGRFAVEVSQTALYVIGRDASAALQATRLDGSGEDRGFHCLVAELQANVPDDLLVFGEDATGAVVLVDLTDDRPRRLSELPSDTGIWTQCPVWSPEQDAFAYSVAKTKGSRVYFTRRAGRGFGEPKLVYESDELRTRVVMLRP